MRLFVVSTLVLAALIAQPTCSAAPSRAYPTTVIGYYDAYYKSTPDPEPTDYKVSAGKWNWREATDSMVSALAPTLAGSPWLHLFYGIDRNTVHSRTMREHSFGENIEKVGDFDFVLKSIVSGNAGAYRLHVLLVDGKSREKLGDCTVPFTGRTDAAQAGKDAAAKIGSLPAMMVRYWQTQRAKSPGIAINPILRITPPASMATGASATVGVSALDCDGVPLKGARISLFCTSGALGTQAVVLDKNGKASFRFHAGPLAFLGSVTGKLAYVTPSGLHESTTVSAPIEIGKCADAWWQLRLHVRQTDVGTSDTTHPADDGTAREMTLDLATREADLVIWYAKRPTFDLTPGVIRTGTPIAMIVNGDYARHSRQSATKTSPKGVSGSIDLVDEAGSLDVSPCKSIYVTLRGNKLAIVGNRVPCDIWIDTFNQGYDSWSDLLASAVDTEKPYGVAYFDLGMTTTVSAKQLRTGRVPLHLHEVTRKDIGGVHYVIDREIDGELRAL